MEKCCADERLAPDDRDEPEEILDHEQPDGEDASDDLAGCE